MYEIVPFKWGWIRSRCNAPNQRHQQQKNPNTTATTTNKKTNTKTLQRIYFNFTNPIFVLLILASESEQNCPEIVFDNVLNTPPRNNFLNTHVSDSYVM